MYSKVLKNLHFKINISDAKLNIHKQQDLYWDLLTQENKTNPSQVDSIHNKEF
jgi:hypothetical protein